MNRELIEELYILLNTNKKLFYFISKTSIENIWFWDIENTQSELINKRICATLGYTESELLGMQISDLLYDGNLLQDMVASVKQFCTLPDEAFSKAITYRNKEGLPQTIVYHFMWVVSADNGRLVTYLTMPQTALPPESCNFVSYQSVIDSLPNAYCLVKTNGMVIDVNNQCCEMTGYCEAELLSLQISTILSVDSNELLSQNEKRIETVLFRKDGVHLDVLLQMQKNSESNVFILHFTNNSTENKLRQLVADEEKKTAEAQRKSKEEQTNYQLIFNSTGTSNSIFDCNGVLQLQNNQSVVTLGKKGKGSTVFDLFGEQLGQVILQRIHRIAKTKEKEVFDTEFSLPGGISWFRSTYQPMIGDDGQCIGIQVISQDITAIKRAEIELKRAKELAEEREKAYRDVVETTGDLITVVDGAGKILFVNYASIIFWGKEPEKCIGTDAFDYIYIEDREPTKLSFAKWLISGSDRFSYENRFVNPQGKLSYVMWNIYVERNNCGEVVKLTSIARDVTQERYNMQEQLKLANIIEKSLNEIYVFDEKTFKFEYVNPKAVENIGYTIEELQELTPVDIKPDFTNEAFLSYVSPLRNGVVKELVFTTNHQRKDGSIYPVEVHLQLIEQYSRSLFLAVINDITERKLQEQIITSAQQKIEESESKFKAAFYTSPDALTITDFEGKYVDVNDGYCRMSGYTKEEVIGKTSTEINIWENASDRTRFIEELQKNKFVENMEFRFRIKNGNLVSGLLSGTVIVANNKPHLLTLTKNISTLKEFEKQLIAAKEKAEESDRLKTAFLQNMSHEIRTPMNAIVGFSGLIPQHFNDKEKLIRFASIINQRSHDLLGIINDILDISKIESGQLQLFIEDCVISELLNEIKIFIDEYQTRISKQSIHFSIHIHPSLQDKYIKADKVKLKQILINLINNALKFTEKGEIECSCLLNNEKQIMFVVRDTGIGIPNSMQSTIFERFSQVAMDNRQQYGGTGLGLSIVKGLVELMGGTIWLESELNKGSCFYFTIGSGDTNPQNT